MHAEDDIGTLHLANAKAGDISGRVRRLLVFAQNLLIEREKPFIFLKDLLVALVLRLRIILVCRMTTLEELIEKNNLGGGIPKCGCSLLWLKRAPMNLDNILVITINLSSTIVKIKVRFYVRVYYTSFVSILL